MKECEKIREWMTAYLAGELSPEDAAVLRVHLETCPACREEWKELSAAWNLTKSMLDLTAYDGTLPDGNRAEIRRAMNPRREFRIAPALWKIAAMFMVCGVILAVAVYSGRKDIPRTKMDVFMSADEVRENVAAAKKAALNRAEASVPAPQVKRETKIKTVFRNKAEKPLLEPEAAACESIPAEQVRSAENMRRFKSKALVAGVASPQPEKLTLCFKDLPEIVRKDKIGVADFFKRMKIELNVDEITVKGDSFEIRTTPETRLKIESVLKKKRDKLRQ